MVAQIINLINENIIFLHIVVLITIISSFISLLNKEKYDGAIAIAIMGIVYIVFSFILKT